MIPLDILATEAEVQPLMRRCPYCKNEFVKAQRVMTYTVTGGDSVERTQERTVAVSVCDCDIYIGEEAHA